MPLAFIKIVIVITILCVIDRSRSSLGRSWRWTGLSLRYNRREQRVAVLAHPRRVRGDIASERGHIWRLYVDKNMSLLGL